MVVRSLGFPEFINTIKNGNGWMIPQKLDIIWADYVNTHHLEKILVRIVSDVLIEKEGKNNESVTRRQAVVFENLTPHHITPLKKP
jgi:hypothetical protein